MGAASRRSFLIRLILSLCWLPGWATAYRSSHCYSYGVDFQDGGSYFINGESTKNFTAYSTFSGCNSRTYVEIDLVMPDGSQVDCGWTPSGLGGITRLTTCPVQDNQLVSGDYIMLIMGNNADGHPISNQRQFHLDVGPQITYTVTPTVTFEIVQTPLIPKLLTSIGFSTSTIEEVTTVPVPDAEIDLYVYPDPITATATKTAYSTYTHYHLTDEVVYATETASCLVPGKPGHSDPPLSASSISSAETSVTSLVGNASFTGLFTSTILNTVTSFGPVTGPEAVTVWKSVYVHTGVLTITPSTFKSLVTSRQNSSAFSTASDTSLFAITSVTISSSLQTPGFSYLDSSTPSAAPSNASHAADSDITVKITEAVSGLPSESTQSSSAFIASSAPKTVTVDVTFTVTTTFSPNAPPTSISSIRSSAKSASPFSSSKAKSTAAESALQWDTTNYAQPASVHGPSTFTSTRKISPYNPLILSTVFPYASDESDPSVIWEIPDKEPNMPTDELIPTVFNVPDHLMPSSTATVPQEQYTSIHPSSVMPYDPQPSIADTYEYTEYEATEGNGALNRAHAGKLAKRHPDAPTITVTADRPATVNQTVWASTTLYSTNLDYVTSEIFTTSFKTITSEISVTTTTLPATTQTLYTMTFKRTDITKNYTATWTKTVYTTPQDLYFSCRDQGGHFSGMRW